MKRALLIAIGWSGSLLIVGAYFLNVYGLLGTEDILYPVMNLLGAIFLGIEYTRKKAFPGTVLELVWGGIAIFNFLQIFGIVAPESLAMVYSG